MSLIIHDLLTYYAISLIYAVRILVYLSSQLSQQSLQTGFPMIATIIGKELRFISVIALTRMASIAEELIPYDRKDRL